MIQGSSTDQDPSSLEAKIAAELSIYLEKVSADSEFKVEPSADLSYMLELYIPELLSSRYPEWKNESLDGVFVTHARKMSLETVELAGMCILISDQTVTPFLIRLAFTSTRHSIASYRVFLGEPAGGRLGISGPPCNTSHAQKLLATINTRLNNINWSYTITNGTD
jgi:hypothetical protein